MMGTCLFRLCVLLTVLAATAFAGCLGFGDGGHSEDAEGVLRFRAGDQLTYQTRDPSSGETVTVEMRVLPPRPVVAANQTRVLGLPLVMEVLGGTDRIVDASIIDVAHGGLVMSVEGCVVEPAVPCRDETSYVTWQECPFNEGFSPADMVSRAALDGSRVVIADPVKPATVWTYALHREAGERVRMSLEAVTVERRLCGGGEDVLLDLREGTVAEFVAGGNTIQLASLRRGTGPEVRLGGGPPQASLLLSPAPRGVHPPGMEALGPAEFAFGEAWAKAGEAEEMRDFLARHPEAFVFHAENTSSKAELIEGTVRQTSYEWRVQVLGADRTMVGATVVKEVTQGLPAQYGTTVSPVAVPAEVPDRFTPPADKVADLQEFLRWARQAGYEVSPAFPPHVGVMFDGSDADYQYSLTLGGSTYRVGGVQATTSDAALFLNADTGRVTDVYVPLAKARQMAGAT